MAQSTLYVLPSSGSLSGVKCFETDVSGKPVGPHLQGSSYLHSLILEDGTIGCTETSVSNHLTSHNILEDAPEAYDVNCMCLYVNMYSNLNKTSNSTHDIRKR